MVHKRSAKHTRSGARAPAAKLRPVASPVPRLRPRPPPRPPPRPRRRPGPGGRAEPPDDFPHERSAPVLPDRRPAPAPAGAAGLAGTLDAAVAALDQRGWYVCEHFTPAALVEALSAEARTLWQGGAFRQAGVGRDTDLLIDPGVRGDWLHWLDPAAPTVAQREFRELMEELRQHLKRELGLPLWELELQYAVYQPGTHYERHVDDFQIGQTRVVTVLQYLNTDWQPEDGGQLRLYAGTKANEAVADVLPTSATFLCFLSDRIPHEVLSPARERFSLGGWFRVRPVPSFV